MVETYPLYTDPYELISTGLSEHLQQWVKRIKKDGSYIKDVKKTGKGESKAMSFYLVQKGVNDTYFETSVKDYEILQAYSTAARQIETPIYSEKEIKPITLEETQTDVIIEKDKGLFDWVHDFIIGAYSPISSLSALQELSWVEIEETRTDIQKRLFDEQIEQKEQEVTVIGDLEALEMRQDLLEQSILEKLGLFQSEEEKKIQSEMQRQEFFKQWASEIPQTAVTFEELQKILEQHKETYTEASGYQIPKPIDIIVPEKSTAEAFLSVAPWIIGGLAITGLILKSK